MSRRHQPGGRVGSPLRTLLVLTTTVLLVTAPVTGVLVPTSSASTPLASTDDPPTTAGIGGFGAAGNDAGLESADDDGGVPSGTVSLDPGQSSPTPPNADVGDTLDAGDSLSEPANVTLITGTTVTVVPTSSGTEYRVRGNASAETVHTDRGTYVFPAGVDLSTFDRALFNVDLLVTQNLTDAEADAVPVIVATSDTDGVGTERVVRAPADVEGVTVERSLSDIGAVAGSVEKPVAVDAVSAASATDAESPAAGLQSNDAVGRVYLDRRVQVHLDDAVNVTRTYRARQQFDVSGEGVRVAVLDTGIDTTHSDLDDAVVASNDFTGNGLANDPYGHGTHVAGIVAGNGTASDGAYRGFAPDARLLNARVLGPDGSGYTSDIVAAMEWATAEDADVISMSLGGTAVGPSEPLTDAVDAATANGVTVVTAAGNDGPSPETVGTPGIAESAITVGATDDTDGLAGFSSRGPTAFADRVKPDLVAPGVGIDSTCSADGEYTCRGTGGAGYTTLSGTSMSAPAVSGVAALLEEQEATDGDDDTDLTPAETKTRLVTSTDVLPDDTVYEIGSGRLNATRALESDLRLSAGTVSAGDVAGANETVEVTVTNTGENESLLPTSLVVTDRAGDPAPRAANVRDLTGDTIFLEPTESKTLTVELNANVMPDTYSARLRFGDGGNPPAQRRTVSLGWQAGVADLRVEKQAATGDVSNVQYDSLQVVGQDTAWHAGTWLDRNATAGFEVPLGNYTVATWGVDESTGQPVLVARTATVGPSGTQMTLSESDTVTYQFDGSNLASDRVDTLGVFGEITHTKTENFTWETTSYRASSARFNTGPNVQATLGVLAVGRDEDDDTEPDFGDGPTYSLGFHTDGIDGAETFAPTESSLSAVTYTLHRGDPAAEYRFETFGFASRDAALDPLGAPAGDVRRIDLRTNNVAQFYEAGPMATGESGVWDYTVEGTEVDPDSVDEVTVNERPFTSTLDWEFDDATGQLFVTGGALADQGPVRDDLVDLDGRVHVVRGDDVLTTRPLQQSGTVSVNRSVSVGETYSVVVSVDETAYRDRTRTRTVLSGTNYADGDGTPPQVERVDVPDLGLNGGVPAEDVPLELTVSDAGENATGVADVQVRYAPGDVRTAAWASDPTESQWVAATVTDATAPTATLNLTDVDADRVSIAIRVTDGNGNSVTHHSYGSLAVGTGTGDTAPPTPSLSGRDVTDSAAAGVRSSEGGGGGAAGGTPVPPAGIVDVTETSEGARLTAEKVKGGRLIRNLLPNVASGNLTVRQFAFTLRADDREFTAAFAASDTVPGSAPAMDGAVAYFDVETSGLADEQIDDATFRFDVSRSALDARGASPEDVRLSRYHDGEWQTVQTRYVGGTTYVGVTPGFSVFAVGVQPANEETTTPTVTPTTTPTATTSSTDTTSTTETTSPGFGFAVTVVALVAVTLLARRRD